MNNQETTSKLPIAIIGAGPVGLAAAAHLVARGMTPLVLERGTAVGNSLRAWGHVRMFSPWSYNIDPVARSLLDGASWRAPDPDALPTGQDIVSVYLEPLARHPAIAPHLVYGAAVTGVARGAAFIVRWNDAQGKAREARAAAVLDASGTWDQPSPIGVDGAPVPGEAAARDRIAYGIPDVLDRDRETYAGRRILVIGGGHSAVNAVLDILRLREAAPQTRLQWALRGDNIDRLLGGGLNSFLPARAALGRAAQDAIDDGRLEVLAPLAVDEIASEDDALRVMARHRGQPVTLAADRTIVATGLGPDLAMLRDLRLDLDPQVAAPRALAPLIDPAVHSCGTVPPHGVEALRHPEAGFFILGGKSYGRAPTFLLMTGYEQVRSVVAELAGDHTAAQDVRMVLPQLAAAGA